jgi:DNA-binding NarL/FixJ family response regulator
MPFMNGLEAAPLLNRLLPDTPIIMFTMFSNEELVRRAAAAGITAVFSKDQAGTHLLPKAVALLRSTSE